MKPQGHIPPSAKPGAHEGADLDVPLITRIAGLLGAGLVVLVLAALLAFYLYEKQYPHRTSEAAPVVTAADLPPVPRLQTTPRLDLQAVRAQEDAYLEGYTWVDRTKGIAHIPIDRAMARWVELQNVPVSSAPNPAPTTETNSPAANPPAATSVTTELQMRQQKAQERPYAP
jgi:hypothetical protein